MRKILSLFSVTAAAFFLGVGASGLAEEHAPSPVTPKAAVEKLKEGNARFVEGKRLPRDYRSQVAATAGGQHPFAAVVSCMDSRAPVEVVFDEGIGDVFSLRVAGNVVDPNFLGSLEYAAKVVGVRLILVMGHTECGAVKGAIDDVKLGNLTGLLAEIGPAIAASGPKGSSKDAAYVNKVAEQNVRVAIKEIREKSPILREMIDSGALGLAGALYSVQNGRVTFLTD
jgi:carbonic anhydrase